MWTKLTRIPSFAQLIRNNIKRRYTLEEDYVYSIIGLLHGTYTIEYNIGLQKALETVIYQCLEKR